MDNPATGTTAQEKATAFELEFEQAIRETRVLLGLLKSAKNLSQNATHGKDDKLYRMTLRRFHDNCLRLAAYAEACALILGDEERERLLKTMGCRWDPSKRRVSLD